LIFLKRVMSILAALITRCTGFLGVLACRP
jgi:hypothetical protein